jgi:hypothetical protein
MDATKTFFRTAGRHFVTLSYKYTPPRQSASARRTGVISGFMMDIGGLWFYVTAGHVIVEIREAFESGGKFEVWRFDDQTAGNAFKGAAVPYDFYVEKWFVLHDDDVGMDYATVHLEGLVRQNLQAGGVVPITKQAWGLYSDPSFTQWVLLGVPAETVFQRQSAIEAKISLIPVKPTDSPPGAVGSAHNKFFGRLLLESHGKASTVKSIEGMSGGPIFATRTVDGKMKYHVIGIQSGWYPKLLTIAACPFPTFASALEKQLRLAKLIT